MAINPAIAAAQHLKSDRYDSEHASALSGLFTTKVGAPANLTSEPVKALTADELRNTGFGGTARRGPQPQDASSVLSATASPSPSRDLSGIYAKADKLYDQRLSNIAAATRSEFSGMASGIAPRTVAASTPAREIFTAAPAAAAPVVYTPVAAALEIELA